MNESRMLLLALLLISVAGCDQVLQPEFETAKQAAEAIYFGGDILTMEGDSPEYVDAVVIREGKILFAGPMSKATDYRASSTLMHDLQGDTLLPGFIDAHGHIFNTGFQNTVANLMSPPDGEGVDIPTLIEIMSGWAQDNVDMVSGIGWIVGFGYDDAQLKERRHPTASDLDKISTELPVMMVHQSAHLMTLNHKALELIGYTASTPNPPGGVIRRESDGNTRVWAQLARQDQLPIDIAVLPDIVSEQDLLEHSNFSANYENHFRIAGVKLTLDGSPQGFTAWLTEPYEKPPQGQPADYWGYPAIASQDEVNRLVLQAFKNDWQLNTHCNGDAAVDQFLNAVEYANGQLGKADRRPVMVHAQTVRFDQLDRMKELAVIPSFFSLHTFYWGDWHVNRTLGQERAYRISPTATAVEKGLIFTQHHDAPIVVPNSMMILHTTVNRTSRNGEIIGPQERVSPYIALLSITRWAAYQYFEEGTKGSLKAGKLADFVILDGNPLKVEPMKIREITVKETIKEGKSVYVIGGSDNSAIGQKTAADYLVKDVVIEHGDAANHVRIYMTEDSQGDFLTIIPSLARGVEDYTEEYESTLTTRLVEAGYKVVLIQPRGIGKSTGDLNPAIIDMKLLADDIKLTLDLIGVEKLHVIGHAFGNRLGRTFATMYPDYVSSVILLASGGNFIMEPEAENCLRGSINMKLADEERVKMIHCAFFAEGNDASIWLRGWYPKLAAAEIKAATTIDTDFYKRAGGKSILLVQATEDFIAPPQLAGKALAAELGEQLTYVEVENAGHALTSEQPELVANHIIEYLRELQRKEGAG